jgi:hypothetical protein
MQDAGIAEPADVHFVQIKCPLLTAEAIAERRPRATRVATTSTYASMGYSRAAPALGVARALDEVPAAALGDAVIAKRWDLFSRVASTAAGVELAHCEILVLGHDDRRLRHQPRPPRPRGGERGHRLGGGRPHGLRLGRRRAPGPQRRRPRGRHRAAGVSLPGGVAERGARAL